jgi:hypothetical protein
MKQDHDNLHDERLQQLAQQLGANAADRLDVDRMAAGVLARLRAGEGGARRAVWWKQPVWLQAAAVLVMVLGGALVMRRIIGSKTPAVPIQVATVSGPGDFPDLSPGQLQDVLAALDEPVEVTPGLGDAGLDDLSEPQLQSLLQTMEE